MVNNLLPTFKEKAIGQFKLALNGVLSIDNFKSVDELVNAKDRIVGLALQFHDRLDGKDVVIGH